MAITDPPLTLLPDPRPLIGDQRIPNASGGEYEHRYAATGRPTKLVPLGAEREMDAAVHAARHALPHWRALPANQRRDMMRKHFMNRMGQNDFRRSPEKRAQMYARAVSNRQAARGQ